MWNIERIIPKGDYNYAVVKNHPKATKCGYVLEHRIIMENHLNRLLSSDEVVHHINGNKKDNCIENLKLLSNREHAKLHAKYMSRKYVLLKCPECNSIFERTHNTTFLAKKGKFTCCSNSCRGKFSRKIQLNGMLSEYDLALKNNVIEIYKK